MGSAVFHALTKLGRQMKNWGRLLIAVGFIWLAGSSLLIPAISISIMSQIHDSLSQETYTKSDVQRIIAESYKRYRDCGPWMFPPAFLMLLGGFLLDRVGERKNRQRQTSISD